MTLPDAKEVQYKNYENESSVSLTISSLWLQVLKLQGRKSLFTYKNFKRSYKERKVVASLLFTDANTIK